MSEQEPVVACHELTCAAGRIGVARLNTPRKLNALGLDMIQTLDRQLSAWAEDPAIAVVVLHGAGGKAFCAGGDIRLVTDAIRRGETGPRDMPATYFAEEYRLDYRIHTYPKPLLVWGEGIVMGGGMGLMAGGSHRVVTPNSLLAMPEITIGLFPDVGATWYLNRMPAGAGLYLGLTGARFNAADALFLGFADCLLEDGSLDAVLEALQACRWGAEPAADHDRLSELLRRFVAASAPAEQIGPRLPRIREMLRYRDVARTVAEIRRLSAGDAYLQENAERLLAGSPLSAHVISAQLRGGKHLSLAECFRLELTLAVRFAQGHDFAEGVRALLIDKDRQPRWECTDFADVAPERVTEHFRSPWEPGEGPLD
ncbi:enoyl-CoA hydratase/isomerase family protein [Alkalilimnicola sp. S0819]|uniref:enoyl-CoA hydratase/isomerase family protein n=1 Tax=Alkalilimnicola sp. S0819 TaxID=2613922 RepID=UPI0012623EA0|nr:enoyl-CoA hydratase/isomerase family protein [Alkalilimnicola sp. S0819]KAB7622652.1 enoyl-CoA hydratase/isomerase family protein [Alkalilimnicola sp. S0819]MPQ17423.1 enoyl-CoA hydratase/isomerase family protein [Alkalilimnicola sp. S0819]